MNEQEKEDRKSDTISKICSIIFCVWFFGSIILLPMLKDINEYYVLLDVGQVFFVIGFITNLKEEKMVTYIAMQTGLFMMGYPIYLYLKDHLRYDIAEVILSNTSIFVCFVIGSLFFTYRIINTYLKERKKYSLKAKAKLVDYAIKQIKEEPIYHPIYEYEIEGGVQRVTDYKLWSSERSLLGKIGDQKDIIINPKNENDLIYHYSPLQEVIAFSFTSIIPLFFITLLIVFDKM